KFYEYYQHYEEGLMPGSHFTFAGPHAMEVGLFFWLYYIMTGLHALHMIIGIGVLTVLAIMVGSGRFMENPKTISNAGLYWHYIDVVWVFLYALFYLVGSR
ncbi:MAG TPA: cytochrome c oxidase subunit 3, partial [Rhodothermales bacterium]|nr:cytochrome c oxidase subunit 3 [Rhodothermales bacterium]